MDGSMKKLLASAFALVLSTTSIAFADTASDTKAQIKAIKAQVEALKAEVKELKAQKAAPPALQPPSAPAPVATSAPVGQPAAGDTVPGAPQAGTPTTDIFGRPVDAQGRTVDFQPEKPPQALTISPKGPGATFLTTGGTVQLYGNIDLSMDFTTKGLRGVYPEANNVRPVGNNGYLAAISSNLSNFGVRGKQKVSTNADFVYQLETQLDVSSNPGVGYNTSAQSNVVKSALVSRNSFIGMSNKYVGAIKIGKTDAPYKNSTARMNPFSAELGDYQSIMSNSGGDNRVEFGTRLEHALWYESPSINGLNLTLLVSPGQNRGDDNGIVAAGSPDCAGGNVPGSGATPPLCNDGSYGSAYSGSLAFTTGKLYLTTAYEKHKDVNRTSDLPTFDKGDVADERAVKGGFQYSPSKMTTFSAIYEDLLRSVPSRLKFQDERSRSGFWFALTQFVNPNDSLNFGWGRANPTPGDTGQHNTTGGANPDNMANLYSFAFKHKASKFLTVYADYGLVLNHPQAHFALGPGGRALTTDCHDGSAPATLDISTGTPAVANDGPHCYAGGRIQGLSTGLQFQF